MEEFFDKLSMLSWGKPTNNIHDATLVTIYDEETAHQLSEWGKVNDYPAFLDCEVGTYYWDDDCGTFYKIG